MKKPKRNGGRWLAIAAALYAGMAGSGIGVATWHDATRPVAAVIAPAPEVVIPPEALVPERMGPDVPPCPAEVVAERWPTQERAAASPQVGTVVPAELNVRRTPGGQIVGQVFRGDQFEILERPTSGPGAGWLRIQKGWVAAKFMELGARPVQAELPAPPCPFPQAMCLPGTKSMFPNQN